MIISLLKSFIFFLTKQKIDNQHIKNVLKKDLKINKS